MKKFLDKRVPEEYSIYFQFVDDLEIFLKKER